MKQHWSFDFLDKVFEESRYKNAKQLAEAIDVSPSAITRRRPKRSETPESDAPMSRITGSMVELISEAVDILPDYWRERVAYDDSTDYKMETHEIVKLPRFKRTFNTHPDKSRHHPPSNWAHIDRIPFTTKYVENNLGRTEAYGIFVFTVGDDIMAPTLSAGDLVLVDTHRRAYTDLMAYGYNNQIHFRRFRQTLKGVEVICDNSKYPSELIDPDETPFYLMGAVRWVAKTIGADDD